MPLPSELNDYNTMEFKDYRPELPDNDAPRETLRPRAHATSGQSNGPAGKKWG
jgi:hypothetical protein